jgi:hypothetical protein
MDVQEADGAFYFRSFNQPVSITPPPAREVGPPKPGFDL